MKRESGENPERTRHCNRGAGGQTRHWKREGVRQAMILKSGDLPACMQEPSISFGWLASRVLDGIRHTAEIGFQGALFVAFATDKVPFVLSFSKRELQ